MNIEEVVKILEKEDPSRILRLGWSNPGSARSNYSDLGVVPTPNVTIGSMSECLKSSIDQTFDGYKGGEYVMHRWSDVHFAFYDRCGEPLTPLGLAALLGDVVDPKEYEF